MEVTLDEVGLIGLREMHPPKAPPPAQDHFACCHASAHQMSNARHTSKNTRELHEHMLRAMADHVQINRRSKPPEHTLLPSPNVTDAGPAELVGAYCRRYPKRGKP